MSELAGADSAQSVPGIDLGRFGEWAKRNLPGSPSLEGASLLSGGHSNLNILLRFSDGDRVLRRPPMGHVMESAHNMVREYRAIAALAPTDVPVPAPVHLAPEPDLDTGLDVPFFIMDFVRGDPLSSRADNIGKSAEQLRDASFDLTRSLAKLHSLDPYSLGLGGFGRAEGYLARQLRRWAQQLEASRSRETPLLDRLIAGIPEPPMSSGAGIVHGDFKMNNALIDFTGGGARVAALLDWEMATLGDPYADLAMFGLYWSMPQSHPAIAEGFESPVDPAAGYPEFEVLLEAYERESGSMLPAMGWYRAFAAMKIAVITESLHYRYSIGAALGAGFERMGAMTEPIAQIGLTTLAEGD